MLQVYRDRDAFEALSRFHRQVDRYFGERELFHPLEVPAGFGRANFRDTDDKIVLEVDVPGLGEGDLSVTLHQGTLALRGEAKGEGSPTRRFARSFTLNCKVDAEKTEAVLKNGVLTVTLAKATEAKPFAIAVKTA